MAGGNNLRRSGWMLKRGAIVKNWKRRWFVLVPGELRYFASDSAASAKGHIVLRAVTDVRRGSGKEFCFELVTPSRVWQLAPSSADARDAWMDAIERELVQ